MKLISKKSVGWTIVLIAFLAVVIYARFDWTSLLVPGALLVWYGLVAPARPARIAVQKARQHALN